MGLITTAVIIAVVAIAIVAGVLLLTSYGPHQTTLTESQAEGLITKDLMSAYPGATISIIPPVEYNSTQKSWAVTMSVAYNATRPCPSVQIVGFEYPALGLQPISESVYDQGLSTNCKVASLTAPTNTNETAIVRAYYYSYTNSYAPVLSYINRFGYNDTVATAEFKGGENSSILGNESNVWLVRYNAASANYSQYAILAQNGTIIGNYTQPN
jgi:hypothetical protein